jgi:diguanylate cyclase (GGDEF)-like protein
VLAARLGALVILAALAWLFAGNPARAEDPSSRQLIAQLQALRTSGDTSADAERQLTEIEAAIPDNAPYPLRRALLRAILVVREDSMDFDARLAAMKALRDLAEAHGDADTVSLMDIRRIYMSHADDNIGKFIDQLNEVSARIGSGASAEVMEALEMSYGNMYFDAGNFDTALRHQLAALDWAEKLPFGRERARQYRLSTIADLYNAMDLPDSALETVERALARSDEVSTPNRVALLGTRALALLKKHDPGAAEEALDQAERLAASDPSAFTALRNGSLRADLLLATAKPEMAVARIDRIADLAREKQDAYYQARAAMLRGHALMQLDRVEQGMALMQQAEAQFQAKGQMVDVLDGLDRQINALRQKQRYARAVELMERRQSLWSQLFRNERGRAIAELEARQTAQELEHRIDKLSNENRIQEERLRAEQLGKALAVVAALFAITLCSILVVAIRRARRERDTLSDAVRFDALTGASSRYQFQRRKPHKTPAGKAGDTVAAVVLLDLDHFKAINDKHGHEAGDAVLQAVVERIRRVLVDHDELYRWGGEEFLVILNRREPSRLDTDVLRLLAGIEGEPVRWHDYAMPVSVSGGYVRHPLARDWSAPLTDAIRWADASLYLAKNAGRRRIEHVELTESGRIELAGRRPIDMPQLLDWQRRGYLEVRTLSLGQPS